MYLRSEIVFNAPLPLDLHETRRLAHDVVAMFRAVGMSCVIVALDDDELGKSDAELRGPDR
jgi:hypothetical protein